jgi:two-component sensor histidine kinase
MLPDVHRKPKRNIGYRITLYSILIATLSFLSVGIVITAGSLVTHQRTIVKRNLQIVSLAAEEVSLYIESAKQELVAIAEVLSAFHRNNELSNPVMKDLSLTSVKFRRLCLIEPTMEVILMTGYDHLKPGLSNEEIRTVLSGQRVVSDLQYSSNGIPFLTIGIPIEIMGEHRYALLGNLDLSSIWNVIDTVDTGDNGVVALLSSEGMLFAHSKKEELFAGVVDNLGPFEPQRSTDEPVKIDNAIVQYRYVEGIDWMLAIVQPLKAAREPIRDMIAYSCGIMAVVFVIIVFVSRRVSRHISNPIRRFVERTHSISNGNFNQRVVSGSAFTELDDLSEAFNTMILRMKEYTTALISSQKRLGALVREKEILLRELHHRVKNNLQIISGILEMKADSIEEDTVSKVFKDSQKRIQSMSIVHEQLSNSENLTNIDLNIYVESLIDNILQFDDRQGIAITINREIQPMTFPIDKAIPLGLIVNELFSNSLTHAFPEGGTGSITLCIKEHDEENIELLFTDDGVGFVEDGDQLVETTLGFTLIHSLTRQLKGTISCSGENGFFCTLIFPIPRTTEVKDNYNVKNNTVAIDNRRSDTTG